MEWHWASISAGCTCHIKPISRVIVGADSSLGPLVTLLQSKEVGHLAIKKKKKKNGFTCTS